MAAPPISALRARTAAGVALALVTGGVLLRAWRYGDLVLFMDEVWAPRAASEHTLGWIFTHFYFADASIPLTLYAKALLSTVGLSEWSLRLPTVVASCLTVALVARICLRHLPLGQAWLATGLVATCPYFVYLGREARPYAVTMLLFPLAWALVVTWARGGPRRALVGAAVCAAVSVWFHPVTGLSVAILWVYPVLLVLRRGDRRARWREVALATAVLAVCGLLLVGPALASFREFMHSTVLARSPRPADASTARNGLALLAGVPTGLPLWLWLAVIALGLRWLHRRHPAETVLVGVLLGVQAVVILWLQSWYLAVPLVWLRYQGHLLPFFVTIVACGLLAPLDGPGARLDARALPGLALGTVLALGLYHARAPHYSVAGSSSYNANPLLIFLPSDGPCPAPIDRVRSPFYTTVLPQLPPGPLLEVPASIVLPLYGVYQRWHRRPVVTGALPAGNWWSLFSLPEARFGTVVPLRSADEAARTGARYLVLHKRVQAEFLAMETALRATPAGASQMVPMPAFWAMQVGWEFGGRPPVLPFAVTPIYEDDGVAVYDVEALGGAGPGSRAPGSAAP